MVFNRVLRYLKHNNIEFRIVQEGAMVDFIVEAKGLAWECTLTTLEREKALVVHSVMLETVPPQLISEMAVFLSNLNQSLVYGNFELCAEEGEVRFKTYLDGRASDITFAAIERALVLNIRAMKKALPKLYTLLERATPLRASA